MLVTLVAFSLAMSSLVYAFRAGAKTYEAISSHQVTQAAYSRIETLLTEDLRGLGPIEKDAANLIANRESDGRPRLVFNTLEGYRRLQTTPSPICNTVEYTVDYDSESGRKVFLRRTAAKIPRPAQRDEPREEVLLRDINDVRFLFLREQEWEEGWEDAKNLPGAVGVECIPRAGKPVMLTVAIPLAALVKP